MNGAFVKRPNPSEGRRGMKQKSRGVPVFVGLILLLLGSLVQGCGGPRLIQSPRVFQLRRHQGPPIPLKAYLILKLKNVDEDNPFLGPSAFAPPEGVQLGIDIIHQTISDSGLFQSVLKVNGPPLGGGESILLTGFIDVVIRDISGTSAFITTVHLSGFHVRPGGSRELLFSDVPYQVRGVAKNNPLGIRAVVMLTWQKGGEAMGPRIANDLPKRLAMTPAGRRVLALASPVPSARRTAVLPPAASARRAPASVPPAARRGEWRSSGSGFLLRGTSHILTSNHVVQGMKRIRVSFPSGESYPGRVVASDANNDLALVLLQGMRPRSGGFSPNFGAEVQPGENVHALGSPLGTKLSRRPSIVSGAVSAATGLEDNIAQFRMTAPINEGNSGGPVVTDQGVLVGVASAGLVQSGVENIRFGTKISAAMLVLQQARLVRKFTIMAVPKERKVLTPPEIFRKYSPYVVLIETR